MELCGVGIEAKRRRRNLNPNILEGKPRQYPKLKIQKRLTTLKKLLFMWYQDRDTILYIISQRLQTPSFPVFVGLLLGFPLCCIGGFIYVCSNSTHVIISSSE